ncbi:MAG: hypothetical protein ACXVEE_18835 [Polyangiales bacterium]
MMDRAQAIPVVASEELEGDDLQSLREETFAAIDEAMSLLSLVLARYERNSVPENDDDFDLGEMCGEVERRMDDEGGVTRITSVAFVAQLGLRGRRQMLAAVPLDRRWDLIAACSSAVREMLKSASAVELGIAAYEDLPATSRYYVTELERALAIRRAYVRFRQDVLAGNHASGARRLRLAASAIAKLVGRPAYAFARVHDRCQIRQFHARIREQLVEHARVTEASEVAVVEVASSRVYQDLVNLAELMMQINLRAELREHDAVLLTKLTTELRTENLQEEKVDEMLARLRPLLGRDSDLDEILAGRKVTARELGDLVSRCCDGLSRLPEPGRRNEEQSPKSSRRATDHPDRREREPEV